MRKSILRLCALALLCVMSNMAFAEGDPVEAKLFFQVLTQPSGEGESATSGTLKLVTVTNPTTATQAIIPESLEVGNLGNNILQGAVSGGTYTVTEIGKEAFANCGANLTEVTVPNSVTVINDGAFNTAGVVTIYLGIPNKELMIKSFAFRNKAVTDIVTSEGSITKATCSNSTVYFYNMDEVPAKAADTKMDLREYPNIEPGAFAYAKVAATVYLPDYEEIPDYMFTGTTGLTNVVLPSDSKLQKVGKWAFAYCTDLTYLGYKTTYTGSYYFFPRTFTEVGDYSFAGCSKLSSKIVRAEDDDARISVVGDYAFYSCTAFVAGDAFYDETAAVSAFEKHFATFGELSYGKGSFSNCALTGVNLNSSGKNNIPEYAFDNQYSGSKYTLANIILPKECISIGVNAFRNNVATTLYFPGSLEKIDNGALLAQSSKATTFNLVDGYSNGGYTKCIPNHLPANLVYIGKDAIGNRTFKNDIYTHGYLKEDGSYAYPVCYPQTGTSIASGKVVYLPVQLASGDTNLMNEMYKDIDESTSSLWKSLCTLKYPAYTSATVVNNGVTYKVGAQDPTTGMYAVTVAANPIGADVNDNATVFAQFIGEADNNGYVPAFYLTGFETAGKAGHTTFDKTITFDTAVGSNETYALDPTKDATTVWCNNKLRKDYEPVTALPREFFLNYGKLTGVAFESGITEVGAKAFQNCESLESVKFGGVTSIGQSAFLGCKALKDVTVNSVESFRVGDQFNGCIALKSFTADKLKVINDNMFNTATALETVNVPAVTEIGANAFEGTALTSITTGAVTKIGASAFKGTKITEASYASVTDLGANAFESCGLLASATLGSADLPTGVFANTATNLTVTTLAESIDATAFTESNLTSLAAPELITIGGNTFKGLTSLTSITAGKVASIGMNAFSGCTGLTRVSFPALTSVDAYAFEGCTGLTNVTLGEDFSVTLGKYIFKSSGSENGFVVATSAQKLSDYSFANSNVSEVLAYKATILSAKAFTDCHYLKYFGAEALTTIPANAFKSSSIETVEIPAVASIGASAFENSKLKSIKPANVNAIGAYFTSLKTMGASAFAGTPLVAVNFSKNTGAFTAIPEKAFAGCESLSSVQLGSVTEVGVSAFEGAALAEITLPTSLVTIGESAFATETLEKVNASYTTVPTLTVDPFLDNDEDGYYDATLVTDSRALYLVAGNWKKFIVGNEIEIQVDGARYATNDEGKYMLYDNAPSITVTTGGEGDFTYVREFVCDAWQCWYVPFDINAEDVEGYTFAKLWDTDLKDDATRIEFKVVDEGVIKANVPYLVKPNEIGKMELSFDKIEKTPTKPTNITVSDLENVYTFTGTYATKEYDSKKTWYGLVATDNQDYQHMNGSFAKANPGASVGAYRFYMTIAANKNPENYVKFVVLDDEDATGISDINAGEIAEGAMFDLQGRRINVPAKGQVYIQNGVKKLAK